MSNFFAHVKSGVVKEIVDLPNGVTPGNAFHASIANEFVACDNTVHQGDLYDGVNFTSPGAPVVDPPDNDTQIANQLMLGLDITYTGHSGLNATYGVDNRTRLDLHALVLSANILGSFPGGGSTFDYPDITGTTHTADLAQLTTISGAMAAYVLQVVYATDGDVDGLLDFPSNAVTVT